MRRWWFRKTLIKILLLGLALASGDVWATPYQLQYTGRLTSATGSPVQGPINLSINFFSISSGGTALQSKNFSNVSLQDGVFGLSLNLTPSEYAQVFSSSDVWIEVQDLTNSKIYPRQHLSASPYAFRVPIDGITLSFDSNGQLSVKGLAGAPLPATAPYVGQVIKWGNGGWEWGTDATSAPGSIDSSAITDGSIGDVDIATNAGIAQNKISGLATALSGKEPSIANGAASQYWRGDKSWATLDTSAVPESVNLYFTSARARSAISASTPLVYNSTSGQISLPQASSASGGYLSSGDWLSFNSKQTALPVGASTDYLRGDKTWAPLSTSVVSEGSNLYYTDARAQAAFSVLAPLSYNATTGVYSLGVASSIANGYLSSSDWSIFNNKQSAIGSGTALSLGKISTSLKDAVTINHFAAASGQTGELRFSELAANGSNYIGFKAPDQIAGNLIWTLPATDGTNGQSLTTDGAGNLIWTTLNAGSGGGVVSITAGTGLTGGSITSAGTIGLANTGVTPGSYGRANITVDAQGRVTSASNSAAIVDADISNTAAIAQSKIQNLSSDLSTINNTLSGKEGTITAGTTGQYYRGDKSWQTLNTSAVPEGSNLYYTDARAGLAAKGVLSGSAPISFSNVSGSISISQASGTSDGYLSSADWSMFNGKQTAITSSTVLTAGGTSSVLQNGYEFKSFGTKAGQTGEIHFDELAANGSNFVGFKAPDSLATDKIWTLPSADGASGQVLGTNGSGVLIWFSGLAPTGAASGDLTGNFPNPSLTTTGVTAGTYPKVTVDAKGRVASGVSTIGDADIAAGAAIAQSKIANLTTDLAAKEGSITAGTTAQYYRGDKSWQTLNTTAVAEGTNLYYTDTRAGLAAKAALSGTAPISFSNVSGAISMAASNGSTNGYLSSTDWTSFNNKQAAVTPSTILATGGVNSSLQNGYEFKPFGTTSGQTGEIRFDELAANGSNFVGFKAPDSLTADKIWTLPAADGSNGQALVTNGAGALSWTSLNSGTVTSVTAGTGLSGGTITGTGTLGLANTSVTPGSYTRANLTVDAQGRLTAASTSPAIVDADVSATAAIAQSKIQNLSSDLSTINTNLSSKEPSITAGTTAQYWRGDKSWQTLNTTIVAEGTNLYYTDARARGSVSATSPIVYSNGVGQFSMPAATSAANGYLSASDWMAFNSKVSSQWITSGANISYVAGNVGIGTSNPIMSLDVNGSINLANNNGLFWKNSNGTSNQVLRVDSNNNIYTGDIFANLNGTYSVRTSGLDRLTISGDGKVGIGTQAPRSTLDVGNPTSFADISANPLNSQLSLSSSAQRLALGSFYTAGQEPLQQFRPLITGVAWITVII